MPRLPDVVRDEIKYQTLPEQTFLAGKVTAFDLVTNRVDVTVYRPGKPNKVYANVAWPNVGSGMRSGPPLLGDTVVLGFLDGRETSPFVVTCIAGTPLKESTRKDLSVAKRALPALYRELTL